MDAEDEVYVMEGNLRVKEMYDTMMVKKEKLLCRVRKDGSQVGR